MGNEHLSHCPPHMSNHRGRRRPSPHHCTFYLCLARLGSGKDSPFCSPGWRQSKKNVWLCMCLAYNLNHPSPFVLTKLSSILMRASNSCSPTCHLGWVEDPSPAGSGTCGRDLYFPGSNITRLSGPPALASVRTYKILRGVYKQTKPSKDPESRNKTKKKKKKRMRTQAHQGRDTDIQHKDRWTCIKRQRDNGQKH